LITLDAKLYFERWLLSIKVAATAAGLEAHVRALDFKGGQRLALEVRKASEALEFCYRKRRTGPHMVAAATGAEIVGRVRDVHQRVLAEHRKLLENGFRRFLRRSIRLLEALESALYRDVQLLPRALTALRDLPGAARARPAAVVRRRRTPAGRYEILPAAAVEQGSVIRFAGLLDGRLVDLCELLPQRKTARPIPQTSRQRADTTRAKGEGITPLEVGSELLLVAADALDPVLMRPMESAPLPSDHVTAAPDLAEAVATGGESGAEALAGAGDVMAEAVTAAGAAGAESLGMAEAAVEVVSNAGTAAEALAETGSALSDAACAGIDCGGLDCIPL
jgi:hypothetical protein